MEKGNQCWWYQLIVASGLGEAMRNCRECLNVPYVQLTEFAIYHVNKCTPTSCSEDKAYLTAF